MTPLGFLPLKEALKKCEAIWGCEDKNAYERLRSHLRAGTVEGKILFADGRDKTVWDEWGALRNDDAFTTGEIFFGQDRDGDAIRLPAFVDSASLDLLFGAGSSLSVPSDSRGSHATGRPPKGGHDAFWVEACRLIFKGECSPDEKTQAEFCQALMNWMEANRPGLYEESTVSDKVKLIWKTLKPRG